MVRVFAILLLVAVAVVNCFQQEAAFRVSFPTKYSSTSSSENDDNDIPPLSSEQIASFLKSLEARVGDSPSPKLPSLTTTVPSSPEIASSEIYGAIQTALDKSINLQIVDVAVSPFLRSSGDNLFDLVGAARLVTQVAVCFPSPKIFLSNQKEVDFSLKHAKDIDPTLFRPLSPPTLPERLSVSEESSRINDHLQNQLQTNLSRPSHVFLFAPDLPANLLPLRRLMTLCDEENIPLVLINPEVPKPPPIEFRRLQAELVWSISPVIATLKRNPSSPLSGKNTPPPQQAADADSDADAGADASPPRVLVLKRGHKMLFEVYVEINPEIGYEFVRTVPPGNDKLVCNMVEVVSCVKEHLIWSKKI